MRTYVAPLAGASMPRFELGQTTWSCLLGGMVIPDSALALIPAEFTV